MIEISEKSYAELLRKEYILESLEYAGVDNWGDYGFAMNEEFDDMPSANEFKSWDDDKVIRYWEERD
jgi:asparagine N-glycosylation enzyme membrane subunit Stt3